MVQNMVQSHLEMSTRLMRMAFSIRVKYNGTDMPAAMREAVIHLEWMAHDHRRKAILFPTYLRA